MNYGDRFNAVLSQVPGKRLTYAELTGKVGETTEPTVIEIKPVDSRGNRSRRGKRNV